MSDLTAIRDLARRYTREALAQSAGFRNLDRSDQMALYSQTYRAHFDRLTSQAQGVPAAPGYAGAMAGAKKASDMIDDERHYNKRIDQAGQLAGEFVDEVDFPGFVKDLLKGVFDANLMVTLQQMEAYQKLLKTATQSVSKFINAIDDTAAFGYLVENKSDEFSIDFGDEKESDGSRKAMLTDKDGNAVDMTDAAIKAKIMDAKIQMAREQRAMLRETILMGITRLVVEKGNVKASVLFDIKASEKIEKSDKAALKESVSNSSSISASGGVVGAIFGGPSGGHTDSRRKTKINISSAKSVASTDLAAKLTGSVDITFKSDYFKLDNFAEMYGPQAPATTPGLPGVAGGARPAVAAPAVPAAPAPAAAPAAR
jgi:hypothetical protein